LRIVLDTNVVLPPCSGAARADIIVSGDRHLLSLGAHGGIRILWPAEVLVLIAAPPA